SHVRRTPPPGERLADPGMTQANAHLLQTMVEIYAVDHHGRYPADLTALAQAAQTDAAPYWHPIANPVNPSFPAFTDGERPLPGAVGYFYDPASNHYRLKAWDPKGQPLRDSRMGVFTLSDV